MQEFAKGHWVKPRGLSSWFFVLGKTKKATIKVAF